MADKKGQGPEGEDWLQNIPAMLKSPDEKKAERAQEKADHEAAEKAKQQLARNKAMKTLFDLMVKVETNAKGVVLRKNDEGLVRVGLAYAGDETRRFDFIREENHIRIEINGGRSPARLQWSGWDNNYVGYKSTPHKDVNKVTDIAGFVGVVLTPWLNETILHHHAKAKKE